jgi:prephenate dehydratase
MATTNKSTNKIAFQGFHGAYSDIACRDMYPDMETLPCGSFEEAFNAVIKGDADLAMIPVDNSIAGRVADVHHLLPGEDLHIIGEYFLPIHHALLAVKGASLNELEHVHSHIHAIPQCKKFIKKHGLTPHMHADTAGAAKDIHKRNDPAHGAIASKLAAQIYDLDILVDDIQDAEHNTTRFIVLSKTPHSPDYVPGTHYITSLVFRMRNIPAALYKALGGFATNNISMAKLESYVGEGFEVAQFYCDVEAHTDDPALKLALEELNFFCNKVQLLGTYAAHPLRRA